MITIIENMEPLDLALERYPSRKRLYMSIKLIKKGHHLNSTRIGIYVRHDQDGITIRGSGQEDPDKDDPGSVDYQTFRAEEVVNIQIMTSV